MKQAKEYQVICHGIDNAQYFQGHGLSFSDFTDCATGIGDTAIEAFNDALEQLAHNGWDAESLALSVTKDGQLPTGEESVSQWRAKMAEVDGTETDESEYDNELWWYVSINVAEGTES